MIVHSAFNRGPRVQVAFPDDGRAKQAFRDECDINKIMAKYVKTGAVSHMNRFAGEYGFATSVDFHEAMNVVSQGESMFAELPAVVRGRFNNDTALFLEFVQDPENVEEMVSLGLARSTEAVLPPIVEEQPPAGDLPPVAASEDVPPVG